MGGGRKGEKEEGRGKTERKERNLHCKSFLEHDLNIEISCHC